MRAWQVGGAEVFDHKSFALIRQRLRGRAIVCARRYGSPHAHTHTSANVKSQTRGCAPTRTHIYENIKKEDEVSDTRVCWSLWRARDVDQLHWHAAHDTHTDLSARIRSRMRECLRECVRVSYSEM